MQKTYVRMNVAISAVFRDLRVYTLGQNAGNRSFCQRYLSWNIFKAMNNFINFLVIWNDVRSNYKEIQPKPINYVLHNRKYVINFNSTTRSIIQCYYSFYAANLDTGQLCILVRIDCGDFMTILYVLATQLYLMDSLIPGKLICTQYFHSCYAWRHKFRTIPTWYQMILTQFPLYSAMKRLKVYMTGNCDNNWILQ